MRKPLILVILFPALFFAENLYAQSEQAQPFTRKTQAYLSFIVPVATWQGTTVTPNFKFATTIGFPIGINVIYSDHFGFNYEITPTVVAQHPTGKSPTSKTANVVFDPGPMFRMGHGFTIIARLAFETSGRYGFTPVFNQVYLRTKYVNYFVSGSLPVRFGNNAAASLGFNVQFGFIFN